MSVNIKKVIELCIKEKRLILFNGGDRQWVSCGFAVYPMLNMPHFNETSIRATYSIPDTVKVEEVEGMPEAYSFADIDQRENQVFFERIQLQPAAEQLVSLRTQAGVTFVQAKSLKPIEEGESGSYGLYERITDSGQIYIAVKQGLLLDAVILPVINTVKPDWLADLRELVRVLESTAE